MKRLWGWHQTVGAVLMLAGVVGIGVILGNTVAAIIVFGIGVFLFDVIDTW